MKSTLLKIAMLFIVCLSILGCGDGTVDQKDYDKYLSINPSYRYTSDLSHLKVTFSAVNPSSKNITYRVTATTRVSDLEETQQVTGVALKGERITLPFQFSRAYPYGGKPNISITIDEIKINDK